MIDPEMMKLIESLLGSETDEDMESLDERTIPGLKISDVGGLAGKRGEKLLGGLDDMNDGGQPPMEGLG